eukprot:4572037-Amphidinium_carterae.1
MLKLFRITVTVFNCLLNNLVNPSRDDRHHDVKLVLASSRTWPHGCRKKKDFVDDKLWLLYPSLIRGMLPKVRRGTA